MCFSSHRSRFSRWLPRWKCSSHWKWNWRSTFPELGSWNVVGRTRSPPECVRPDQYGMECARFLYIITWIFHFILCLFLIQINGTLLAASTDKGSVILWTYQNKQILFDSVQNGDGVANIFWSPFATHLFVANFRLEVNPFDWCLIVTILLFWTLISFDLVWKDASESQAWFRT